MSPKRKTILALLISIGMLLFSYWVTNLHFPISGEKEIISIFEAIRGIFGSEEKKWDDVLLIDVLYDKELITKTDELGRPLGDGYAITDRKKLQQLLWALKDKEYAYILLDVAFEKGEDTDADSALFATINSMERIVIACDSVEAMPHDVVLREKAGLAHYYLTPIESDFVKYPYLLVDGNGISSMPLIMYENTTKHKVKDGGFFYIDEWEDGWRLARKSVVLNIDYIPKENDWVRLGDLLYNNRIDYVPVKGKYIVIGSSKEADVHATYRGPVSGAVINLNAFKALMEQHHWVSQPLGILLFITFFFFSYLILSEQKLSDVLASSLITYNKWLRIVQRVLILLCSWIGFSLFLSLLCVFTYCFMHEVYDIIVTSTMFWVIKKCVKLKNRLSYAK